MFFILSKLLIFLLKPITWVAGLLLWSWFSKKRKRWAVASALVVLLVFSNPFLFNTAVRAWEQRTITADKIEQPYDIGILLGGFSAIRTLPTHDRHNFNDRANRFTNTLELYFSGKIKKILITGGSGRLLEVEEPKEAVETKSFLLKLGVPESDIIIEPKSRNTYENAAFTKALLEERGLLDKRLLLITSAWHMPRAQDCFEAVGVEATPFSVDFLSEERQASPDKVFLPNARVFYLWELILKEWVGILAYQIKY
jgi:uncharacterized SAM-binding protein YcdF (DUF218 family)